MTVNRSPFTCPIASNVGYIEFFRDLLGMDHRLINQPEEVLATHFGFCHI
jgi:hypothetical protein